MAEKSDITKRLLFLAEQFDVYECETSTDVEAKLCALELEGYSSKPITNEADKKALPIAILSTKQNERGRVLKKTSMSVDVFSSIVKADPTENKMYLQWMLNLFSSLIKASDFAHAKMFVLEDLPLAERYLELFDGNKRKKKFKDLCEVSYSLKGLTDPTNINQYKSLSQLFDAVDPFIEKEPTAMERTMAKFVMSGQAIIPVKDRKFTLYIPKTRDASVIFADYAGWCTARIANGNFVTYTENNKKPNGENSDLYIIINNEFFTKKSEEMYQIHFETDQIMDRSNKPFHEIFDRVISKSEGIANFFNEELLKMAKAYRNGINGNKYITYLLNFGFAESYFELFDDKEPNIQIRNLSVPRIPDVSRFQDLERLIMIKTDLTEIHPSVGKLKNLFMLAFIDNKIEIIPPEIGDLSNLVIINLCGNPIKEIPNSIAKLDPINGGKLQILRISENLITKTLFQNLQQLLPSIKINKETL